MAAPTENHDTEELGARERMQKPKILHKRVLKDTEDKRLIIVLEKASLETVKVWNNFT